MNEQTPDTPLDPTPTIPKNDFLDRLTQRIEKAFSKGERKFLPFFFIRAIQIFFVATFLPLFFVSTIARELIFGAIGIGFYFAFVLIFCEITLRLLRRKKNLGLGFYSLILLAFPFCATWGLALSIFGTFAILNPESQNEYLRDSPEWVKTQLSKIGINYLT